MCTDAKGREGSGRVYYMKFILLEVVKSLCGELVKNLRLKIEVRGQRLCNSGFCSRKLCITFLICSECNKIRIEVEDAFLQ